MSWSFLTRLLEEIHNHSTFVGKVWLTVLIIFRIVLTAVGGESIYSDEQTKFMCNTKQPGCDNVCYDAFAPLSHVRFWVFQIIMISTPSVMYLGYAIHKIARTSDDERRAGGAATSTTTAAGSAGSLTPGGGRAATAQSRCWWAAHRNTTGRRRIVQEGLMRIYVLQLMSRAVFEISFLAGQYLLPTEKTIFLLIMYVVSCLCLLLNICEMFHLGIGTFRDTLRQKRDRGRRKPYGYPFSRNIPSSPPGYNLVVKSDKPTHRIPNSLIALEQNMANMAQEQHGDCVSPDENIPSDLASLHRHLRVAQEQLDMAFQTYSTKNDNQPPSRTSSPMSGGTVAEQNRVNTVQEKQGARPKSATERAATLLKNGKTSVWI
ncbi:hypothetical protein CRUP_008910 [Coryphaenoides rupestris]|nr:hypothetical protein CRUP_008910 [Coryphaenoides rupestris]